MDSQRSCAAGFVCTNHVCDLPADAGTGSDAAPVGCMQNSDCPTGMPVCDAAMHQCRTCTADGECASSVCDVSIGTCVDSAAILFASPTGPDTAMCTLADPCSLTHAVGAASATRYTVKLLPGTYISNLTVSGKSLVMHGQGATLQVASGSSAGLEIEDGAQVVVVGLHISEVAGGGGAIRCEVLTANASTPSLQLTSVAIDAQDRGIYGNPCSLMVANSTLHGAAGAFPLALVGTAVVDRTVFDGGDEIFSGGAVEITNSVIANLSGGDSAFIGGNIFGTSNGSLRVSFSTVINSLVKCPSGTPVCAGGSDAGACIDNTIFLNTGSGAPADTITGTACFANYVIAMPQSTALNGANNNIVVDPLLVNPAAGDYHLKPNSPAIDTADPTATATPDLDGTTRPQGARADIGAYEYKP